MHLSMSIISVRFAAVRVDGAVAVVAAAVDFDSNDGRVGWEGATFRRFAVGAVVPSSILSLAGSFHCGGCHGLVG